MNGSAFNKNRILFFWALCCAFVFLHLPAFSMDSLHLADVHVIGKKTPSELAVSLFPQQDVNIKMRSLADALQESGVSMRSSGPGNLSLASVRGLYGNQINILWEGISIQSPMNGNFDLALIPSFLTDNAVLLPHSHSSNSGNASLSGTIALRASHENYKAGYTSFSSSLGSFSQRFFGVDHSFVHNKTAYRTRFCKNKAAFDYPILGYEQTPFRVRQENNDFNLFAILQEIDHAFAKEKRLVVKVWLQQSKRGISESIAVDKSQSRQEDVNLRAIVRYHYGQKQKQNLTFAVNQETIRFLPNPSLTYFNQVNTLTTEWGGAHTTQSNGKNKAKQIAYGLQQFAHFSRTDNYAGPQSQFIGAAYASLRMAYKKSEIETAIRVQAVSNQGVLPAPSFAIKGKLYKQMNWRFHSGFSFRFPTLNDLFWMPGGNPNLKAEQSLKSEFSIETSQARLQGSLSFFQNELSNMIVWLPDRNLSAVWTPQNLRGVRVLGVETRFRYYFVHTKSYQFALKGSASFTRSVYSQSETGNEIIKGKQLMFIPVFLANPVLQWSFDDITLEMLGTYQSQRFISTTNSRSLAPFFLMGVQVSKAWKWRSKWNGQLGLCVQNIFNTHYEFQPLRPLPGRSISFNLIVKILH